MSGNAFLPGYVLAGGRSSRMGQDKAEIVLGGRTMLEIAVGLLQGVCTDATVVGARQVIPAGARQIADGVPGCGPMGGMEAALRDCAARNRAQAVFLPVDMPFLPEGLLRELVRFWMAMAPVRVAVAVVDDIAQPLVSSVQVAIRPALTAALERGQFKLMPALREAAGACAGAEGSRPGEGLLETRLQLRNEEVNFDVEKKYSWRPTATEWQNRDRWFANLNTPGELQTFSGSRQEK